MAVAVTESSCAACLALSWRAAASKALSAESDGSWRCFMNEFSSSIGERKDRLSASKAWRYAEFVVKHR
jgi:hypothetical protein